MQKQISVRDKVECANMATPVLSLRSPIYLYSPNLSWGSQAMHFQDLVAKSIMNKLPSASQ